MGREEKGDSPLQISGGLQADGETSLRKTRSDEQYFSSISDQEGGQKSCDYLTVYVPCPPCWASVHHGVGAAPGLGCAGDQGETQEDRGGKEGKWSWKNGGWCPLAFSLYLVLPFIK